MKRIGVDHVLCGLDLLCPVAFEGPCGPFARLVEDSRQVCGPEDLLVLLPGKRHDLNFLIQQAKTSKAGLCLVQGPMEPHPGFVQVRDQRQALEHLYGLFYPTLPQTRVAVTGTDGKTSVSQILTQLWQGMNMNATCLGTLGFGLDGDQGKSALTTPHRTDLYSFLETSALAHKTHVVFEASSQALDQGRFWPLLCDVGIMTNLFHDHLDYHGTQQAYGGAKMKLFSDHVQKHGIIHHSLHGTPWWDELTSRRPDLKLLTYGTKGEACHGIMERSPEGHRIRFEGFFGQFEAWTRLVGDFQAENILAAICAFFLTSANQDTQALARHIEQLKPAKGRLELVALHNGAKVYVDYAHTPQALCSVLSQIHAHGARRIFLVFGAGGNRDWEKRFLMGKVAQQGADVVVITDDNPRDENPVLIRQALKKGCPKAVEIADRKTAICHAMGALTPGDVLLVAGKGHETVQIVADKVTPFSDHQVIHEMTGERKVEINPA